LASNGTGLYAARPLCLDATAIVGLRRILTAQGGTFTCRRRRQYSNFTSATSSGDMTLNAGMAYMRFGGPATAPLTIETQAGCNFWTKPTATKRCSSPATRDHHHNVTADRRLLDSWFQPAWRSTFVTGLSSNRVTGGNIDLQPEASHRPAISITQLATTIRPFHSRKAPARH